MRYATTGRKDLVNLSMDMPLETERWLYARTSVGAGAMHE